MKKWIPWIVVAVFAAWLVASLRPPRDGEWAVREFGPRLVHVHAKDERIDRENHATGSTAIHGHADVRALNLRGELERHFAKCCRVGAERP